MNQEEEEQKEDLAEHNAIEKFSLELEISDLNKTLRRWRYSVTYIVVAITIALVLQIHLIVR